MGCGCGKNKRRRMQSSRMPSVTPTPIPQTESQNNSPRKEITPNQRRSEIAKIRNTRKQINREKQKQFRNQARKMTVADHVNNRKPK